VKHNIPQEEGVSELIKLLKEDGLWIDPPETSQPKRLTTIPVR
jgi:hypothetical protein